MFRKKNTILGPTSFFFLNNSDILKKILSLLITVLLLPVTLTAQKEKVQNDPTHDDRPIHFGFSLGVNAMDYRIELSQKAIQDRVFVGIKELSPGINIHAIANLRLAKFFDLRALPGISFGGRITYFVNDTLGTVLPPDKTDNKSYKKDASYLEFPLTLKYKAKRLNNFRPYIIAGGNTRYDLAVKAAYDLNDQLIMTNPLNFFAEVGFGGDFYLTYFKLGIELKYSFGLTDIYRTTDRKGKQPDANIAPYTNYIQHIYSNMFIISFHFE